MRQPASLKTLLADARIIPVLVIEDVDHAVPLARALVAGGLTALEITLRTPVALECIRRIKGEVEGASVGVGTALTPADLERSEAAGAIFAVSPGATPDLLKAATMTMPLLAGAASPSESMALLEAGFAVQKLFPSEPTGGVAYLKALGSVLQTVSFCPTGGIDPVKAPSYLALPNVVAIGGSWMAPPKLMAEGRWAEITALARACTALARS
jgi:2-dehydro-3-deoxyphosphogluconate aldolase / (4S)-4-hydroxy-2-oxoglutarate aldolase